MLELTSIRVKWNAGATKASDDIPISLRTQNPVVLGDES